MQVNNRLWVLGTIVVIIAVAAMGWFFGISPKLDEASANASDLSSTQMQNDMHEIKLAKIKAEYENLETLQFELASLRTVLPAGDELSTFIGELHALEQGSAVTITSISSNDGMPYVAALDPKAEAAAEQAAAEQENAEVVGKDDPATAADAEAAAAAAKAAAAPGGGLVTADNFVVIPLDIAVRGDRAQVMNFVDALQKGTRLFLVTTLTVTEGKDVTFGEVDEDGEGGEVITSGGYTGAISGFVYVLLDPAAAAPAAATPGETATAAPAS